MKYRDPMNLPVMNKMFFLGISKFNLFPLTYRYDCLAGEVFCHTTTTNTIPLGIQMTY
jgi:hypothetical protein